MIYLDHNATTPLDPLVLEAMGPYLAGLAGNASSQHAAGRAARRAIEGARSSIARAMGADPAELIFTSGATEANNLAVLGAVPEGGHVLVSPAEHPSVLETARRLRERGAQVEELALDAAGRVANLALALRPDTVLVAIQLANSETGCLQPIEELARLVPERCWFHCDAVQAVGKVAVDFSRLAVTTLAISGHKLHGPQGIGALFIRRGRSLPPLWQGGHQERGVRPGTEPVPLIVGLGAAIERATQALPENALHLERLRDQLEEGFARAIPDVVRNQPAPRLPNTANLSFLGVEAQALVMALDLAGLACSAGTACASGAPRPSAVLRAMGLDPARVRSALRFSVGRFTTPPEIEEARDILAKVVGRLRESASSRARTPSISPGPHSAPAHYSKH